MATISYLWKNRVQFPFKSKEFIKVWGKRFISLPELMKRNNRRKSLIRKGASIHETAEIGEIVYEGNRKFLKVNEFSFIGKVYMAAHTSILIGKRVCINDGVKILTASHDVSDPEWKHLKGEVVINDYAWIGTDAMLLPGVTIGFGAVVGARAVVTKSVPPNAIVVGNPAKLINKERVKNLNYNPCEFLAANRAWLIG